MQVVYARCCGLDVHQKSVVACVLLTAPDGQVRREVRSFGTMTADLLALNDWLNVLGVEQVALESFNGKFRDECLNVHWFRSLADARRIIEDWRESYNTERPHSALGGRTPTQQAVYYQAASLA